MWDRDGMEWEQGAVGQGMGSGVRKQEGEAGSVLNCAKSCCVKLHHAMRR